MQTIKMWLKCLDNTNKWTLGYVYFVKPSALEIELNLIFKWIHFYTVFHRDQHPSHAHIFQCQLNNGGLYKGKYNPTKVFVNRVCVISISN